MTLRAYAATLLRGEPQPHDHAALRWVSAAELDDVDWVPADRGFLPALGRLLTTATEVPRSDVTSRSVRD